MIRGSALCLRALGSCILASGLFPAHSNETNITKWLFESISTCAHMPCKIRVMAPSCGKATHACWHLVIFVSQLVIRAFQPGFSSSHDLMQLKQHYTDMYPYECMPCLGSCEQALASCLLRLQALLEPVQLACKLLDCKSTHEPDQARPVPLRLLLLTNYRLQSHCAQGDQRFALAGPASIVRVSADLHRCPVLSTSTGRHPCAQGSKLPCIVPR